MTENEKLRTLLLEAKDVLSQGCWSGECCQVRARIDEAFAEPSGVLYDPPTYACLDCGRAIAGLTLTWSHGEGAKTFCVQCRRNRMADIASAVLVLVHERDEAYAALRKVLKHQPWPSDDASERDFNEARKVLEGTP